MNSEFERMAPIPEVPQVETPFTRFKEDFGNTQYKTSWMTYVSLSVILLFIMQGLAGDQTHILKELTEPMRIILYIATIGMQWLLFAMLYYTVYKEGTLLKGVGINKLRTVDFSWGFAVLLSLFVTGLVVSLILTAIGIPPKGEVAFLLPTELTGKIIWVFVSFTAGFCEEIIFRGYLMTRIRMMTKSKSWVMPVIVSALAFGFPHIYQGLPGFITITLLGVLFSISYIYTKTLWPAILAHFFLDFLAIIIPIDF